MFTLYFPVSKNNLTNHIASKTPGNNHKINLKNVDVIGWILKSKVSLGNTQNSEPKSPSRN